MVPVPSARASVTKRDKAPLVHVNGKPNGKGRKLSTMNREEMEYFDAQVFRDLVTMAVGARVHFAEVKAFARKR